jgi:gliding motility associated protien GldN
MMKRIAVSLSTLLLSAVFSVVMFGQGVTQTTERATTDPQMNAGVPDIQNVYEKIHIPQKKAVPYSPIREADVMWSKDVWRIIDLREKLNQPLYYPIKPIGQRLSLFGLIMHGVREENLHAYKDDKYNLFATETLIGEKEIIELLGADTLFKGTPDEEIRLKTEDVKQVLVKEKWFFDKQHSTMKVRIMGLAPIKVYNRILTDASGNITISPEVTREVMFWIYFPEYRDLFAKYEVFNPFNDSQNISFDDLFLQRRFASFIYAESNQFDDRFIPDYLTGDDILYEAEKIKQKIFEFEHDLWEY